MTRSAWLKVVGRILILFWAVGHVIWLVFHGLLPVEHAAVLVFYGVLLLLFEAWSTPETARRR